MKLNEKVQHALDETRMLILGVQVLLGFDFQLFFLPRFDVMPRSAHVVKLVSVALLLVTMALLFAPISRHRLVDEGEDTRGLDAFTRGAASVALVPFAASLGCDFYGVGRTIAGTAVSIVMGLVAGLSAVAIWAVLPWLLRKRGASVNDDVEPTKLNDKVRQVLTEARVVLPGTQALLGFQLVGTMQEGFDRLPASSKLVHLISLAAMAISMLILMLPAAYHRIAEQGEVSERLHVFSGRCVLAGMGALSAGIAGALFVVFRKGTASAAGGITAGAAWLLVSLFGWFGSMLLIRARRRRARGGAEPFPPANRELEEKWQT